MPLPRSQHSARQIADREYVDSDKSILDFLSIRGGKKEKILPFLMFRKFSLVLCFVKIRFVLNIIPNSMVAGDELCFY